MLVFAIDESVPSKRRRISQEQTSEKADSPSVQTGIKRTSEKDSEAKETDNANRKRPMPKPARLIKQLIAEAGKTDGNRSDDAKVPTSPDALSTPPPLLSPRSPTEMPCQSTAAASPNKSSSQMSPSGAKGSRLGSQKYRKNDSVSVFIKSLELLISRLEKT